MPLPEHGAAPEGVTVGAATLSEVVVGAIDSVAVAPVLIAGVRVIGETTGDT
jgi:hypothetical protein